MRSHNQQRQARSALLVSRARRMLHAPTPSEEALWQALRVGALGVAFKRQVVLGGRYIADFFAPSAGLIVEVDGGVHRGAVRRTPGGTRRCADSATASCAWTQRWFCAASRRLWRACNLRCGNSYRLEDRRCERMDREMIQEISSHV